MPRYAAFLRGVMPTNAKMPELKRAFEAAGFADVKTLLGSGNVLFDARSSSNDALQRKAEAAMQATLGRTFLTFVRSQDELQAVLEADPYARLRLAPGTRKVVTFLRAARKPLPKLPVEDRGARVLALRGLEAFSTYQPGAASFMTVIEKTLGKDVTTRTWETVQKAATR
jgi:uncharacterized protein (DUF1697 family)